EKKVAEIVMRRVVVSSNRKSVVPERLAVFPIRRLHKRAPAQRDDDYCRNGGAEWLVAMALVASPNLCEGVWAVCSDSARSTSGSPLAGGIRSRAKAARHYERHQVRDAPNNHQIQTDLCQVGVSIRACLLAGLYQADHRHEHPEIPKPAGENVRSFLPPMDCQQADCDEKCSCQKNLPEGQLVIRVRIESRQPGGPEHLPNVGNATDSRVVQSPCEWQLVD